MTNQIKNGCHGLVRSTQVETLIQWKKKGGKKGSDWGAMGWVWGLPSK